LTSHSLTSLRQGTDSIQVQISFGPIKSSIQKVTPIKIVFILSPTFHATFQTTPLNLLHLLRLGQNFEVNDLNTDGFRRQNSSYFESNILLFESFTI